VIVGYGQGDGDLLAGWVTNNRHTIPMGRRVHRGRTGLRVAFYGRTSTLDFQDRLSSLAWQREVAECMVPAAG
jgi:site-specific DNA recombinase